MILRIENRRFFYILILMAVLSASCLISSGAFAVEAVNSAPALSVDEFQNVPPGLLMQEEETLAPPAPPVVPMPQDEVVMTMDDLLTSYAKGEYDLVAR